MKTKLSSKLSYLSVAIFAATLQPSVPAIAQESVVEEIVVTGSNIRRKKDFATPSPIQTVDQQALESAGVGQVQDLLRTLPANAGSELNISQSQRQGTSQFSLRGLGTSSTLTLINGRRAGHSPAADDSGFFFTDVNQYPVNMIKAVEVLTDGASATYGSEAVGGVVNLITRDDFEGFEFGVEARDASNRAYQLNAAFGTAFEKGHFTTFVNYYTQDGNFRGEFDFLNERSNADPLDTSSSWDSGTGSGRYQLAEDLDGDGIFSRTGGTVADPNCGAPNAAGVVNTFISGSNCRYNFVNQRRMIAEEQRFQVFTQFDYDLTDSVEIFSELSFSSNEVNDAIGGAVLRTTTDNGGFYVPGDHPFNYFVADGAGGIAWDEAAVAADPTQAVGVVVRQRPLTTLDGELADDIERQFDNSRAMFGVNADLSEKWSVNASYMYARSKFTDIQPRSYNAQAYRDAIGSFAWNPFASANATPDAVSVKDGATTAGNDLGATGLGLFAVNRTFTIETAQQVAEVIFSGELFDMGGGQALAAVGAQYREQDFQDIADSLSEFRLDGRADPVFSIRNASQDVYAIFAEAILPVADALEIQLAARYEDYGTGEGGDQFTPKVGVRWEATDALMLRASFGSSFQAPSIRQIFGSVGSGALDDRATALNPGDPCAADPDSFNAAQITTGGALDPQTADNYNLGLVFRTDQFTGSVDYWYYDYQDRIAQGQDFQDILDNECPGGTYTPDARVVRDAAGQLNSVTSEFVNLGGVETDGVDLAANYVIDGVLGGELMIDGKATYINSFDIDPGDGAAEFDGAGNRNRFIDLGSVPELRANAGVTWRTDRHQAGVSFRYISDYDDNTPTDVDDANSISSQTVVDLQYSFNFDGMSSGGNTVVTIGVNNVADRKPPEVSTDRIAFDSQVHDPRGRIAYLRATHNF